ncbi:MAG: multicopper oxidase domain-containing protein [Bowdeniella nasicola]|nr:multicopper oxidase domain-containing protein [Bowdeniella nasicola]
MPITRSRWHDVTGAVVLVYLIVDALLIVNHRFIPDARWLMVHAFTLGAITNALFIWTEHFSAAILRHRPDPNRREEIAVLVTLNVGILSTVYGMVSGSQVMTGIGASVVGLAIAGHAIRLVRQLKRALPARFTIVVQAYAASAALVVPGIICGYLLSTDPTPTWRLALLGAHITFNILGWVALPIVATLLTLWPTILRAPLPEGAERVARHYLPALMVLPAIAALSALTFPASALIARLGVGTAVLAFALIAVRILTPLARTTWSMAKGSYPAMSVAAGAVWFLGTLAVSALVTARDGLEGLLEHLDVFLIPLLGGGIAQILLGSLSYLMPVMMGGGPRRVRVRIARVDTWAAWRIVVINASLAIYQLASGSLIMVVTSLAAFVGALVSIIMVVQSMLTVSEAQAERAPAPLIDEAENARTTARYRRGALIGALTTVALVCAAIAADPVGSGLGWRSSTDGVNATGETTQIDVDIEGMRFIPDLVEVPVGNRLELRVHNGGNQPHDLVLENGAHLERLSPGQEAVLDAGVIASDLEGWCSIAGHRQMGMVFHVRALGGAPTQDDGGNDAAPHADHEASEMSPPPAFDLSGAMDPSRRYGPVLAPLEPADGPVHREVRLTVTEQEMEAAPGLSQSLWTFNGTMPGPTLHGRVGDTFEIELVNDGTMGHSIDFHAGALAPDEPMRTIEPGERLTYTFTAERAGIWMYHCSTAPMSLHIANGMYGAVVIEPRDLPDVDHSVVLVQAESYYGAPGAIADAHKIAAGRHDTTHFNGYPDQYVHYPLKVHTGDRVRIWVLDAGPNVPLSFHVVGGQFDTVYKEGSYLLTPGEGGSQALGLLPAEGGFVELVFPEAGHYTAVNHIMSEAERGARAMIEVTDP